ncbi:hypothetical protein OUZ56_010360 [Daphnia magna]|uniref:Uncharacterized protein n=1 Tax=Daphnia magna TaxID=35525 RepID=A0ABR0AIJ2_9CRUS|nr:hypothetical protein OUZ56_010360 [Daphnia magna]
MSSGGAGVFWEVDGKFVRFVAASSLMVGSSGGCLTRDVRKINVEESVLSCSVLSNKMFE